MKAIEILYNLSPYQNLLDELFEQIKEEDTNAVWTRSLSSQYSFITLEIRVSFRDETPEDGELVTQVTFEIRGDKVILTNVYCDDDGKTEALEKQIKANSSIHDAHWHKEPNNTWYHDEPVTAYVNIADEIAGAAYNCAPGDNYSPGYFSEIKVDENQIILSQVNWHNAKSSDHKDDYHMRKLHFHIPLNAQENWEPTMDDNYRIGNMLISFSDRSSPQNKTCGKRIVEQIHHQQAGFQNKK